ncbi:MAG: glycosyltransferase [Desulfomonile tiedjei]|nr:glycosyltransferase [Desulfomonile tiedjei]
MSPPKRPIRILHVIDTLRPGGAEQMLLTNVRHLPKSRFESVVVALFPPLDLKADLMQCDVPVHCLGMRGRLDWRRGVLGLARLLRDERIDIVHTHLSCANIYGRIAAWLARVPVVVTTLHFCEYSNMDMARLRSRIRLAVDRFTSQRINSLFLAVSTAVMEDYRSFLRIQRVEVLYNSVDPDVFAPPSDVMRQAARRALALDEQDFVLINVARLHREKGQEYLIRATRGLIPSIPRIRLFLVGDGPAEEYFRTVAREEGLKDEVTLLGSRRDIVRVLAAADLFVFPSVAEGLGIALLEAMAMEKPVVATRAEGIKEVLEDGANGLLVEPCDPSALAEVVRKLHADPILRKTLGAKARATVVERFSTGVGVRRLEAIYAGLAGQV